MQVGRETARCAGRPVAPSFQALPRRSEVQMLVSLMLLATVDSAVIRNITVAPAETLRTTTFGTGRPVVVIPGLLGSAYAYRKVIPSLNTAGLQVIVVE